VEWGERRSGSDRAVRRKPLVRSGQDGRVYGFSIALGAIQAVAEGTHPSRYPSAHPPCNPHSHAPGHPPGANAVKKLAGNPGERPVNRVGQLPCRRGSRWLPSWSGAESSANLPSWARSSTILTSVDSPTTQAVPLKLNDAGFSFRFPQTFVVNRGACFAWSATNHSCLPGSCPDGNCEKPVAPRADLPLLRGQMSGGPA
jgi:hypothetical protein